VGFIIVTSDERPDRPFSVPCQTVSYWSHAFAIKLAEAGCEMHFISEVLGHHSIDFTRKQYAKFSPQSATRAVLRGLEGGKNGTNLAQAV
jgi:integrase